MRTVYFVKFLHLSHEHAILPYDEVSLVKVGNRCETRAGKRLERVEVQSVYYDINDPEDDEDGEEFEIRQLLDRICHDSWEFPLGFVSSNKCQQQLTRRSSKSITSSTH